MHHLKFAEDLVIFAGNPEILQKMLKQQIMGREKVGFSMNIDKTKLMTNSSKIAIKVNNETVEYIDDYIYLGQTISPYRHMSKEIQR